MNAESVLKNKTHKLHWDFEISTDHLIPAGWTVNKIKRTGRIVNFAVLADHRVKIKENEKKNKYLNITRKLKLWNMNVTVMPIAISILGTIPKSLIRG